MAQYRLRQLVVCKQDYIPQARNELAFTSQEVLRVENYSNQPDWIFCSRKDRNQQGFVCVDYITPYSKAYAYRQRRERAKAQKAQAKAQKREKGKQSIKENEGTCQICFVEEILVRTTERCRHENKVCGDCRREHARIQIEETSGEFRCPCDGCQELFTASDVQEINDKRIFDRFDHFALIKYLQTDPFFRWCKNPKCGSGQHNFDGDDAPIMTCTNCSTRSCFTHDVIWHEGLTCGEYTLKLHESNLANAHLLQQTTKPCPKCNMNIEKNGGCDHMKCRCKYEFCWLCLADYQKIRDHGNHHHNPTCKHYFPYDPQNEEEENEFY